ncbi:MAG: lysophospholipid acyltransferase family protein [Thermodesulfobacteriota bacterium]
MQFAYYVFRYGVSLLLLIFIYSAAILIGLFYRPAAWDLIVTWNRLFLRIFGVEPTVEFTNKNIDLNTGGVMIGLTQQSLLDPIIGIATSPKMFMSIWNIEYALIPFVGWISWIFGWVILRQNQEQAIRKFKKAEAHIRRGGLVYLSIEGKRSIDGSLSPYKKGPAILAIQAEAKIIPIIVLGSRNCLPFGEWRIRPGKVVLRVLDEVRTDGMNYEDRDLLVSKLREIAERELAAWEMDHTDPRPEGDAASLPC